MIKYQVNVKNISRNITTKTMALVLLKQRQHADTSSVSCS